MTGVHKSEAMNSLHTFWHAKKAKNGATGSVSYLILELMSVLQKASERSDQAKLFLFLYTIMKIAVHHEYMSIWTD
jgi:hypothetical protein